MEKAINKGHVRSLQRKSQNKNPFADKDILKTLNQDSEELQKYI